MATSTLELLSESLFAPRHKAEFVSFRDASAELSVSESTLRRLHKAGKLEARRISNRLLIPRHALDNLLNRLS